MSKIQGFPQNSPRKVDFSVWSCAARCVLDEELKGANLCSDCDEASSSKITQSTQLLAGGVIWLFGCFGPLASLLLPGAHQPLGPAGVRGLPQLQAKHLGEQGQAAGFMGAQQVWVGSIVPPPSPLQGKLVFPGEALWLQSHAPLTTRNGSEPQIVFKVSGGFAT